MSMLRMYVLLIRASIRSQMQYPLNFWLSTVLAAIVNAIDFLLISLILWKFDRVQTWSLPEIGYLYGTIMLSKAIYRSLANDVHHLERYLLSGELDSLLLRPVPVLLALMTQNFRIMAGEVIQGAAILGFSLSTMLSAGQVNWTIIPWTVWTLLNGAVILYAIGLGTSTCGFWITKVSNLQNVTEDAARTAVQYPLELYPIWLRSLLLTVIPVGLANYVPALYLLRGQYGWWLMLGSAAFGLLFLGLMLRFWRFGLSRYQSTGS